MKFSKKFIIKISNSLAKRVDFILLRNKDFCIISNNCWGSELYGIAKREYNTPFVGLFLSTRDYIKFIKNIEHYVNIELTAAHFVTTLNAYPVAQIDECNIHFLHYSSQSEAIVKWNRRRKRLIKYIEKNGVNALSIKLCVSSVGINEWEDIADFKNLPFLRKVLLSSEGLIKLIYSKEDAIDGMDLFKARILYYNKYLALFHKLPNT